MKAASHVQDLRFINAPNAKMTDPLIPPIGVNAGLILLTRLINASVNNLTS